MLAKRIVPCLDIKEGKTVKGVNFVNFRDAGDPDELGAQYSEAGADELVYLDITASYEDPRACPALRHSGGRGGHRRQLRRRGSALLPQRGTCADRT